MQCTNCGFENPEGMNYCGNCGLPLTRSCPSCGQVNPPTFRFCGYCGTPLEAAVPVAPEPPVLLGEAQSGPAPGMERRRPSAAALPEGERLQLTLMFCDLVGSTALSTRLDPEELHEIVQSYQSSCGEIIERFGGYVAQHLGDGILAYFGYPVAHEREAGAAVRSGLAILAAVNDLNLSLGDRLDVQLAVRIGIHTGVVVVGTIGGGERRERLALGEVPNIAARLQALAEPNTMVVSAATHRLVAYEFGWKELGRRTIRGLERKERVYRVIGERSGADSCQDAPAAAVPPPLGRERELALLQEHWRQAMEGRGQVVVISGDGGIGKTNLVQGFVSQLDPGSFLLLEGRCQPYYQNTAYHPIIDLLQRQLDCPLERGPLERRRALVDLLEREGLPLAETLSVLARLLSIPTGEPDPPAGYLPQQQKERTRAALIRLFFRISERRPLILCVEDLHWADPSTLELLDLLADKVPAERALLLLTHRPGFRGSWGAYPHLARIDLSRLDAGRVAEIVGRITEGRALPPEVLEQIVEKTDGVPLFVEELTKMVLESGLLRDKG
ncbi:MAG TPA: AAA family ATPase, partial [Longimicrobiaceae bacterium]|nr:AAA family ATPase [Longimicrobiaceae bacterium]